MIIIHTKIKNTKIMFAFNPIRSISITDDEQSILEVAMEAIQNNKLVTNIILPVFDLFLCNVPKLVNGIVNVIIRECNDIQTITIALGDNDIDGINNINIKNVLYIGNFGVRNHILEDNTIYWQMNQGIVNVPFYGKRVVLALDAVHNRLDVIKNQFKVKLDDATIGCCLIDAAMRADNIEHGNFTYLLEHCSYEIKSISNLSWRMLLMGSNSRLFGKILRRALHNSGMNQINIVQLFGGELGIIMKTSNNHNTNTVLDKHIQIISNLVNKKIMAVDFWLFSKSEVMFRFMVKIRIEPPLIGECIRNIEKQGLDFMQYLHIIIYSIKYHISQSSIGTFGHVTNTIQNRFNHCHNHKPVPFLVWVSLNTNLTQFKWVLKQLKDNLLIQFYQNDTKLWKATIYEMVNGCLYDHLTFFITWIGATVTAELLRSGMFKLNDNVVTICARAAWHSQNREIVQLPKMNHTESMAKECDVSQFLSSCLIHGIITYNEHRNVLVSLRANKRKLEDTSDPLPLKKQRTD